MSGTSFTVTLACDATRAAETLARLAAGDFDQQDIDAAEMDLDGRSRNNAMEWTLAAMIRVLRLPGLRHLQMGFDPASGQTLDADGPWSTLLQPEELPPAAASLRKLCALAREQPATVLAAMGEGNRGYDADDLRAAVADDPSTYVQAAQAYLDAREGNDGDDFASLFAYVQAHAFLLERAHARGLSIVHVAWFC